VRVGKDRIKRGGTLHKKIWGDQLKGANQGFMREDSTTGNKTIKGKRQR